MGEYDSIISESRVGSIRACLTMLTLADRGKGDEKCRSESHLLSVCPSILKAGFALVRSILLGAESRLSDVRRLAPTGGVLGAAASSAMLGSRDAVSEVVPRPFEGSGTNDC